MTKVRWILDVSDTAALCVSTILVDGLEREGIRRIGLEENGDRVVELEKIARSQLGESVQRELIRPTSLSVTWNHPNPCQTCLAVRRFGGL
jgi:hypothetical protein